ncbi:hypothetical protein OAQ80_06145 [Flavobacteriaceae bacterium]|nr:hypothetical protein [Flavobacteriaceae bacterium]
MKNIFFIIFSFNVVLAQIPNGKKVVSSLYIYDMIGKESILLAKENRYFEAPNWARNGTYLLINSNGKIEKILLKWRILRDNQNWEFTKV